MPDGRYLDDSISLLHASAAIRARPEMYVGDVNDPDTLVGLACAPLCLAIDRSTGGPARTVEVERRGDRSIVTWMPDAEVLGASLDRTRLEERLTSFRESFPCIEVVLT